MKQQKGTLTRPLNQSMKDSVQPGDKQSQLRPDRSSVNDVLTQSVMTVENQQYHKLQKRYRILTIVGSICVLIAIFFIVAVPPILKNIIQSSAIDMVVFSKDNQGTWAHWPGDTHTQIVRNYSFFNFVNAEDVLLYGAKPKFYQIQGYKINELEDYINITYLDNGNIAKVIDWLHFEQRNDSKNLDQKVNILNIGKLGYWYQLKNTREAVLSLQGMAIIFTNLQTAIKNTVIAQGISSQFLANFTSTDNGLFSPAGIQKQNRQFLWNDPAYGLKNQNNLGIWVNATLQSIGKYSISFSTDALILKDYFTLNDNQILSILKKLNQYIESLESLIFQNHYCVDMECSGRNLAVKQMAQSFVTFNTPPVSSISPSITICQNNFTCKGYYPQLNSYFKKVYLKQHPQVDSNLIFNSQTVMGWFNYNDSDNSNIDYNTKQNCLLHIGNLDALWNNGTLYDQTGDNIYIQAIRNRFGFAQHQIQQTKVFWQWIKYFTGNVIKQKGNNQNVGISTFFAQGLYNNFIYVQDNLQTFLLQYIIYDAISADFIQCQNFYIASIGNTNPQLLKKLCQRFPIDNQNDVKELIYICKNKYQQQWKQFLSLGVSYLEIQQMCDSNAQQGFGFYYHFARVFLNTFYSCDQTPNPYCSDYQLAVKQWANSTVSRLPIPQISHKVKASNTIADWFPAIKPFEYYYFTTLYPNQQFPIISTYDAYRKLNFDNYFSSSVIQSVYMNIQDSQFNRYIRYIVIFIGMDGFTMQRTVRQLMFGYTDQLLESIRVMYPPFGGDPSTPSSIAFNDLNITKQQANLQLEIQTGKNNYTQLGQFKKINHLPYLTIQKASFNGNQTKIGLQSPWIGHDYFYGTAAKFFSPNQFDSGNISIYIPNLQRYGSGSVNDTFSYERYGYDLLIAYLGESIYLSTQTSDLNKKYYQSFYAVFNETGVLGIPFFVTKNHFMNCTSNWSTFVEMYDETGAHQYKETSHWDDSFVIIQPYSGASFQSTIFLQSNYYYQPDQLFRYPQKSMLPVFSIYRSGNLTEDKATQLFGPLKTGLSVMNWAFYIGIALLVIFIIVIGFSVYNLFKMKNQSNKFQEIDKKDKKLEISLQKQAHPQKQNKDQGADPQKKDLIKVDDDKSQ